MINVCVYEYLLSGVDSSSVVEYTTYDSPITGRVQGHNTIIGFHTSVSVYDNLSY